MYAQGIYNPNLFSSKALYLTSTLYTSVYPITNIRRGVFIAGTKGTQQQFFKFITIKIEHLSKLSQASYIVTFFLCYTDCIV